MNNKEKDIKMGLEVSHSRDHLVSAVPRVLWEQAIYEVTDNRLLPMTPTLILEKYDSVKLCTCMEAGFWGGEISIDHSRRSQRPEDSQSSEQTELSALHSPGKSSEVFNMFTKHGGLLIMTWGFEGASPSGALFIIYFSSQVRIDIDMNAASMENTNF